MPTDKAVLEGIRQHCIRSSAHIEGPFIVTREQQEHELTLLRATCDFERFFFVVNLKDYTVKHSCGIARWLGHHDDMTMDEYMSWQHLATLQIHAQYGAALISKATNGELPIGFMRGTFSTLQAIRHQDERYLLVKRISSAFQLNHKRQVTEYLNEFTIIGDYNGEPFEARAFNIADEFMQGLRQYIRDRMYQILPFTIQELNLLRIYAYFPNITEADAGAKLKPQSPLKPSTVKTYKTRIREKAEGYFQLPFQNIYGIVDFLKKEYLL